MSADQTRGLFLKPPEKLPSTGVTKISFKVFLNQLFAYLEQDPVNYFFMKEECYAIWNPKQGGKRIAILSEDDPDKIRLDKELEDKRRTETSYTEEKRKLLLQRNSQLGKCVQLVAVHCYYTEQDDIDQCSTSMAWIVEYLEKHYNIQSKGVHFLDIASLTYKKGTPHQSFFKQFRSMFMDNLRKAGDKLEYKNDEVLGADEKMTPTLESTIVLWALERIEKTEDGGTQTRSSKRLKESNTVGRQRSPLRLRACSGTSSSTTSSPRLRTTTRGRTPGGKQTAPNKALLLVSGSKCKLMADYSREEKLKISALKEKSMKDDTQSLELMRVLSS